MGILDKLSSWFNTSPSQSSEKVQTFPPSRTALGTSAEMGSIADVKKLLAKGVDVNEKDDKGRTALMWAAFKGHADIVKELLVHGAEVNAKDNYDYTALKFVDLYTHGETVKILKDAGAVE